MRDFDDDHDRRKNKSGSGVWVWILLVVGIIGVLVIGCCGCGSFFRSNSRDSKWEKFTPPDAKWSAEFPGQPKMYSTPTDGTTMTSYIVEQKFNQEAYVVNYFELDSNVSKSRTDRLLDVGLTGLLNGTKMKSKEVSRRDLTMAGVAAKELTVTIDHPTEGPGRMIFRVLVIDNRFYGLSARKMSNNGQSPEHAERFFNSFVPVASSKK